VDVVTGLDAHSSPEAESRPNTPVRSTCDDSRVTDRTSLPSEQQREGQPSAVGFEMYPTTERLERAGDLLAEIAAAVTMVGCPNARPLRICFALTKLPLGLPHALYGFHLVDAEPRARSSGLPGEDREIVYALVVNQPLNLVREVAIRFLFDLIGRAGPMQEIASDHRPIDELPGLVAASDSAASSVAWETLSFSWRHALEIVQEQAAAAGYCLEVRHQLDPLPKHGDVSQRMPAHRELYRAEPRVRKFVDGIGARVGGKGPHLRGGSERVRGWLQQHTTVLGLRQYIAQSTRDGEVFGNGYLEMGMEALDAHLRCIRPESVELTADGRRWEQRNDDRAELGKRVAHVRGVEQIDSPYGISSLEPLLFALDQRRIATATQQMVTQMPSGLSEEDVEKVAASARMAEHMHAEIDARLDRLLALTDLLPVEIPNDLYLPGCEVL